MNEERVVVTFPKLKPELEVIPAGAIAWLAADVPIGQFALHPGCGGTLFHSEKTELSNKVEKCLFNISSYHLRVIDGAIPIALIGWSL